MAGNKQTNARRKSRTTDTNNSPINMKSVNRWIENINTSMDTLYNDTYLSNRTNISDLENISGDIENDIDAIIKRNSEFDISNIGKLYSRMMLKNATSDTKIAKDIEEALTDTDMSAVLTSYMSNKWIKDLDNEIDTVLKYCTKMAEALDLLRDAVIAADSTNKDSIIVRDADTNNNLAIFDERTQAIAKRYNMNTRRIKWYDNASRYGEQYVYCVPYNKVFTKMLKKKEQSSLSSIPVIENGTLNRDLNLNDIVLSNDFKGKNFKIEIDTGRKLQSAIDEAGCVDKAFQKNLGRSLNEQFIHEDTIARKNKLDKTIDDDNLELPEGFDSITSDGVVDMNYQKTNKKTKVDVKGGILKDLKHENLIPIYFDDVCVGYTYFEFNNGEGHNFYNNVLDTYGKGYQTSDTNKGLSETIANGMNNANADMLLKKLSGTLSLKIDAEFINANQDLSKEIYAILKHNNVFNSIDSANDGPEAVRVSFLPVEDVHRLCFNEDEDTHRGISDVAKGLIPAKLFSCLYITNATGILTRGQDKRVYYVKQTVETNIAQTMLNVINQIKKSNFNIRQIENMNNILNITGRFNDYIIPVGPSGDSPVQFEVMPGQQFEINSDLYNMLEEMAVNSTGIPIELVQSRLSPDFAMQFTSSSIKVLRMVYNRQGIYEEFEQDIWTKLYNYDYPDKNITIECELPPPIFLSMTNTSQLIANTKEYVMQIAEYEYEGEQGDNVDAEKALFIKKMMRSILSSYVRSRDIERYKQSAKMEVSKTISNENQ